jgi:hypothetical protein
VLHNNTPAGGFRRISDEELAWNTAKHFDVKIAKGGIIQIRDGKYYSDPQLLLIQGEKREIVRLRHDHEQVSVLPSAKGEAVIIAKLRTRVGGNDPDELAHAMELQKRLRKLVGAMVKPLDYEPGSALPDEAAKPQAPKASEAINPDEFMAAQKSPEPPKLPDFPEISSMEWQMRRKPRGIDFADLEY